MKFWEAILIAFVTMFDLFWKPILVVLIVVSVTLCYRSAKADDKAVYLRFNLSEYNSRQLDWIQKMRECEEESRDKITSAHKKYNEEQIKAICEMFFPRPLMSAEMQLTIEALTHSGYITGCKAVQK